MCALCVIESEDILLLHTRKNSVSVGLSVCASGACEEKAKVKRSYSNPQKNRVSLSLSVRRFSFFTLKPTLTLAFVPFVGISSGEIVEDINFINAVNPG